jgi:hypothetical protein
MVCAVVMVVVAKALKAMEPQEASLSDLARL